MPDEPRRDIEIHYADGAARLLLDPLWERVGLTISDYPESFVLPQKPDGRLTRAVVGRGGEVREQGPRENLVKQLRRMPNGSSVSRLRLISYRDEGGPFIVSRTSAREIYTAVVVRRQRSSV